MSRSDRLRVDHLITGRRDRVYDAWTRRELMGWFCPEGMTIVEAEADVRVGGEFRCSMRGDDGELHTCFGVYEEIVPGRKLAFTHSWEEREPVETHVVVELEDRSGGTEVIVSQRGFIDPEEMRGHERGWASTLRNLARQFPRPTTAPVIERSAAATRR
jgi:uncharacterized protein YndB with AHSA1/START domain